MNPYEADPTKIPADDLYADLPLYGRYLPQPESDFIPDPAHINSATSESLRYWDSVLAKCDVSTRLYDSGDGGRDGGRDVFALGTVIVKSSHLKEHAPNGYYALGDVNEVAALQVVRKVLAGVGVEAPRIYFAGKIKGRNVLIQSRIPGVGLNVAWPYLFSAQKSSFKAQARQLLCMLYVIHPHFALAGPSYVMPDDDPIRHRGITEVEYNLLFGRVSKTDGNLNGDQEKRNEILSFMHNNLNESNIIVNNDKIVGLVDWEMAGWFGLTRAGAVHAQCRTPSRDNFAKLNLAEERLVDLTYWNDLYAMGLVDE